MTQTCGQRHLVAEGVKLNFKDYFWNLFTLAENLFTKGALLLLWFY